jgi:molecular chaperone HtpG
MELNPDHQIVVKLFERFQTNKEDPLVGDYADLLFGYGLLAEGSELPDPVRFNRLVADLMARSI